MSSTNVVVESKGSEGVESKGDEEVDMEVRVTNVEQDRTNPNLYRFCLENSHVSYANTLRRLMMTGVETIAFRADMVNGTTSDVQVKVNDTPMTNEMLAHRIGLLPIHINAPITFKPEDYVFTLDIKGSAERMTDVTCSDFVITKVPVSEGKEPTLIPTEEFFPKHPISKDTCLIATLPAGTTRLHLVAKASLGNGRLNARYQPTSQCSYTYTLDDNPAKRKEFLTTWLKNTKRYTDIDEESDKFKAYVREFQTMEINRIYKKRANGEPYSFDFIVETVGPLDVPYIIQRACDVGMSMMNKYRTINTDGFNPKINGITIQPSINNPFGIDFILEHQDHTFGNMIQTYLAENHMADKVQTDSPIQPIVYVGYEIPHQLRDEMVLRIGLDINTEDAQRDARNAFAQACDGCYDVLLKIRTAFNETELRLTRPSSSSSSSSSVAPVPISKARAAALARAAAKPQ